MLEREKKLLSSLLRLFILPDRNAEPSRLYAQPFWNCSRNESFNRVKVIAMLFSEEKNISRFKQYLLIRIISVSASPFKDCICSNANGNDRSINLFRNVLMSPQRR